MRLTVRTLLAYRDKVLEPDLIRMLQQKIAENSFAGELMSRIDSVVRNREVGVYKTHGNEDNLDVETSASYLDNTIAPDRIADIERACLVSDVALAEVAACHEILSRALHGPAVAVPKALRDRLRSATPATSAPPPKAIPSPEASAPRAATKAVAAQPFHEARPSQQRIFISHSSQDQAFVEREIVSLLRAHGVAYWYAPADIRVATHWERTILKGLESCDWFLLVMSPRSQESEWVKDELHWAMEEMAGRIIPVIMEACKPSKFHIRLPRIQALDFEKGGATARQELIAIFQAAETPSGDSGSAGG